MYMGLGRRIFMGAVLAMAAASTARAQDKAPIAIEGGWARATAGMARTGAAYLTIRNTGAAADRVVSVASPVAATVEMHAHLKDGDVMRMRPVAAIDVAPGAQAVLQPGGLHLMLLDLKGPLKDGDQFPVTLTFEKAGPVTVTIAVRRNAPAAAGAHSHTGS